MGKIHFIWAGGHKLMPASSIAQVQAWKERNPGAEIWIWVDQETLPSAAAGYYGRPPPLGFGAGSYYLKNVRDLSDFIKTYAAIDPEFSIKMQLLYEIALYEANRLRPNFGASSDIWRCLILFFHSGSGANWSAYFDHDVAPGEEKIDTAFTKTSSHLLFAANSQYSKGALNDAFICRIQYSLILKCFLEKIYVNYTQAPIISSVTGLPVFPVTRIGVYNSDESTVRENETILRTGPRVVTNSLAALFKAKIISPLGWEVDSYSFCTKVTPSHNFAIPLGVCPGSANKRSWVEPLAEPSISLETALNRAVGSIAFEARIMGIMRLDDHVKDIVDSLDAGRAGGVSRGGAYLGAPCVRIVVASNQKTIEGVIGVRR